MKKMGEIMHEMGFDKNSSESTQIAFIKYLIRVAKKPKLSSRESNEQETEESWQELKTHSQGYKKTEDVRENQEPTQLEFGFFAEDTKNTKAC